MNPNLYTAPLSDTAVDDLKNRDGLLETVPLLSLDLPDEYIIRNLHNLIQNSSDYFNEGTNFNLTNKRIKNLRMFRGDQIPDNILYHYQTPFKDNELYVGVDAIIAYITAAIAELEVYPANKSPEAKIFAKDLLTYGKCYNEEFDLDAVIESIALNLLTEYVGILKWEWDPDYGEFGEIIPKSVKPSHYFVDKRARRGQNPRFEGEVLTDSIEGLINKFPKKEKELLKLYGIKIKGQQNTSKELAYREVWFTYYDKKGKKQEAVAWYIQDIVLDKRKNPNWLYDKEGENFLKNPGKPYIKFNLVNDGEHVIDFTGPVEQAVPAQDILNKEGRQIIDNLSTANGFRIVLAGAMTDDALENLTGDPNQSVVVKGKQGQSIDDIYKQIEPHLVSAELIADKNQNRDVIHSILGTPSQFRGDDTDQTKTASEAQLIKNQASGRQDKVVRSFNRGLSSSYKYWAQMIAVYYTDEHTLTAEGGDGNFDFITMHQDKIKKGMTIRVYSKPSGDKAREEAIAQNSADLGFSSPLDYYKDMHLDNAQTRYDNLVKWKTQPQELTMDMNNDEMDEDAVVDFTSLLAGDKVEQRDDITPQYLDSFRKQMISDDFLNAKKSIQNNIISFIRVATIKLGIRNELDEASNEPLPPLPLPPQVQATLPAPAPSAPLMPGMPPSQAPMMPAPQPGMPPPQAAPPGGLGGSPLPPVGVPPLGIQGALQTAQQAPAPQPGGSVNLNPTAQPMPAMDISQLTPR